MHSSSAQAALQISNKSTRLWQQIDVLLVQALLFFRCDNHSLNGINLCINIQAPNETQNPKLSILNRFSCEIGNLLNGNLVVHLAINFIK